METNTLLDIVMISAACLIAFPNTMLASVIVAFKLVGESLSIASDVIKDAFQAK
jgi:ABC-type dipeptide/oligopeptide/nickel transport system permease subunit